MRCCDCEFRHMCNEEEKVLTAFARCEKRDLLLYEKQELKTYTVILPGKRPPYRAAGYGSTTAKPGNSANKNTANG